MTERCDVAIVGSGFTGSLLARVLTVLGRKVVLLERGTHPRFAIGESTTPLANLSLERLAARYGLDDCRQLAAHGRWLRHHPELRRGLKRGFTYYRHHPGRPFEHRGLRSERLLVAASPTPEVADTHWVRADVDHHFVRAAAAAGVDYRDRVQLAACEVSREGVRLRGTRVTDPIDLHAGFLVDASGPGGFLARQLAIPSGLDRARAHSGVVFSHFTGVKPMDAVVPDLPAGPYPEDWAAVHHVIDEGWMYSLRFDHGVTSAGFTLTPRGLASLDAGSAPSPDALWAALLARYPTIAAAFADARPTMPLAYQARIQHRLVHAAGDCWALLPHAYAFTDPLFSTGIAWGLRAVERLALAFEDAGPSAVPARAQLARYEELLAHEADQIDALVAGSYEAMSHFDLFVAHAMIYFTSVSYAETRQRLVLRNAPDAAWSGFLGVDDPQLASLPAEAWVRLRRLTGGTGHPGDATQRAQFADWVAGAIAPRNVGGFLDPARRNMYPVDLDVLVERHALLGLGRDELVAALPALRGAPVARG